MTRQRFLAAALATTVLGALSAASAPAATGPVPGATYVGGSAAAGQVAFTVSRDGRRVYDLFGLGLQVSCHDGSSGPERLDIRSPLAVGFPIARDGSFGLVSGGSGSGSADFATQVGPGGAITGKLDYNDQEPCSGSIPFTAAPLPHPAGTPRRVFTLARTLRPVAAYDLGRGRIGVTGLAPRPKPREEGNDRGWLQRVDGAGRVSKARLLPGGYRSAPSDAARLSDGSIVLAVPGALCLRRVDRRGRLSTVGPKCDEYKQVANGETNFLDALPHGRFVFGKVKGNPGTFDRDNQLWLGAPGKRARLLASIPGIAGVAGMRDGTALVSSGNRILRVTTAGKVTVAAGSGSTQFSGDGGAALAAGMLPRDIAALPGGGYVFFDATVGRIREVTRGGRISTFAGGGEVFSGVRGTEAAIRPTFLDALRDGTVVFGTQGGALRAIPPRGSHRLLVGLPDRQAVYEKGVRAHGRIAVTSTGRARLTVRFRRGKRTLGVSRLRVGAGTTRVSVPARARRATRIELRATAGKRVATDVLALFTGA